MTDLPALVTKLEAWTEHDFHADRQLADEILVADGWTVHPDPDFEGGVRWEHKMQGVGTFCCGEAGRPNPVNDMNAAMGLIPFGMDLVLYRSIKQSRAIVSAPGVPLPFHAKAREATVAVCIAALKALAGLRDQPDLIATIAGHMQARQEIADGARPARHRFKL